MDRILITICGRAGSKGFKNKNLKVFLGHPLVHYACAAATYFQGRAQNVDICLNTDSEELIALVAEAYPAIHIIRRPEKLGGDRVPKLAVFQHSLSEMEARTGAQYDYLIDMDITSPLRKIDDAWNAYQLLASRSDAEMAISVCESRRSPYFNMVMQKGDYVCKVLDSSYTARQQAPAIYDMNAAIYVLRASFVRCNTSGMILEAKTIPYLMEDTAVLDIDSEMDFELMSLIGGYLFSHIEPFAALRRLMEESEPCGGNSL